MLASVTASHIRVILSVAPRILGDALSVVLADENLEAVVLGDHPSARSEHYDVAVVSGAEPDDLDADAVIYLPDDPRTGAGRVATARSEEAVTVVGVEDLVAAVRRVAAALRADPGLDEQRADPV
jgi:hypothetical protein